MLESDRLLSLVRKMDEGQVLTTRDIRQSLGISQEERKELRAVLRHLCDQGLLESLGQRAYRKPFKQSAASAEGGAVTAGAAKSGRAPSKKQSSAPAKAGGVRHGRSAAGDVARGRSGARGKSRPRVGGVFTGVLRGRRGGGGTVLIGAAREGDHDKKVFVKALDMGGAIHGDQVRVEVVEPGQYRGRYDVSSVRGRVTGIVSRDATKVPGTFYHRRKGSYVVPDDPRLPDFIPVGAEDTLGASDGEAVIVELPRPNLPGDPRIAIGKILERLGTPGEPEAEIAKIILEFNLPLEFPGAVTAQADALDGEISEPEIKGRVDFRDYPLVTIDGADARDFDDAVGVRRLSGGRFELVVAIADVAHYVKSGSAIDLEALDRGNSVYFPRRVIPMLPDRLCNDLCSLKPDQDRLALAVTMIVGPDGHVVSSRFAEAVIRSHARLTYDWVSDVLDGKLAEGEDAAVGVWREQLGVMLECAKALSVMRSTRGTMDFDVPEPMVLFRDDSDLPSQIVARERTWAHRMIEEFMLAANGSVGNLLTELGLPAIFRVHGQPAPDKLETFFTMAGVMGYFFPGGKQAGPGADWGNPSPGMLGSFLKQLDTSESKAKLLNRLALRAMQKAIYSVEDIGHYGLGIKRYLHFTSPIRRYPDLAVHRILKMHLASGVEGPSSRVQEMVAAECSLGWGGLDTVAERCTALEQQAMHAEYAVLDFYKAYIMKDRVGEQFNAFISGMLPFGFFVELEGVFVEGLVRVEKLEDDYYEYDPEKLTMTGRSKHRMFKMGDRLRVQLEEVNLQRRQLDFILAEGSSQLKVESRK